MQIRRISKKTISKAMAGGLIAGLGFNGVVMAEEVKPQSPEEVEVAALEQALAEGDDAQAISDEVQVAALEPEMLIDAITVVGSAAQAKVEPGSVDYFDAEILERQSYADIHRILRRAPGINLQEEDGYGLRPNIGLRGTGLDRSEKITLMEDGVLIAPATYAAPAAYYFPTAGRMSAVEVTKGVGAIKYGPRTAGGAVNLISTPIPEDRSGLIDLTIGDDSYTRVHAWVGDRAELAPGVRGGILVETWIEETDGFKEIDANTAGSDTGFELEDYLVKFGLEGNFLGIDQIVELKGGYTDHVSNETYLGLTDADFAANPYRRYRGSQLDEMDWEHKQIQLTHLAELRDDLTLTTVAYYNDFQRNWYKLDRAGGTSISTVLANPTANAAAFNAIVGAAGFVSPDDALRLKNNNREYYARGVQTVASYEFEHGDVSHAIEASVRYHEDEMDRFQWTNSFRMDNGTMVLTTANTPGTDSNRIDSAEAWAVFVRDEIMVGNWVIAPGLRYEDIDLKRENFGNADPARTGANLTVTKNNVDVWMPGLGVTYGVNDELLILAGAYKGFTPPGPGSTAKEEEAVNYELGARYNGKDGLSAELIGFFSDYDNLIGTCTASTGGGCAIGAQFDGGEVEVQGVELRASHDLSEFLNTGNVNVPVWLSYTYTETEFKTSFNSGFGPWGNVTAGDELPYIPENQLALGIGLDGTWEDGKAWQIDTTLSYVDEIRTQAGQGSIPTAQRVESHTVVDVAGSIDIKDGLALTGSVQNIFDEDYAVARRPAGLRPGKPLTARIGLKADL